MSAMIADFAMYPTRIIFGCVPAGLKPETGLEMESCNVNRNAMVKVSLGGYSTLVTREELQAAAAMFPPAIKRP